MDDLDLASVIYLEDKLSSEEKNSRMAEDNLFKSRGTGGAWAALPISPLTFETTATIDEYIITAAKCRHRYPIKGTKV
ncbi:hypothetical protein EVAR_66993_1 [Eumeta japonica]|uniref:Uncharacterized protein n=1 Tax=Eumeta variegata TaxID=151549 RepID=A0A4C1ZLB0_EUMVA|nr:hypothetical protein EVAR_66993_1 [Eumeta japonica]